MNLPQRIEVIIKPEGTRSAAHGVFGPSEEVPVILDGCDVGRIAVSEVLF